MSTDPFLRAVLITCAHCRHAFEQPRAWLERHRAFRCPKCDGALTVELPPPDTGIAIGRADMSPDE